VPAWLPCGTLDLRAEPGTQPPRRSQPGSRGAHLAVLRAASRCCSPAEDASWSSQGRGGHKPAGLGEAEPGAEPSPRQGSAVLIREQEGMWVPLSESPTPRPSQKPRLRLGCSPRCSLSVCGVKNAKSSALKIFSEPLHPLPFCKHQPSSPSSIGATRDAPSCCHVKALMEIKQAFTVKISYPSVKPCKSNCWR